MRSTKHGDSTPQPSRLLFFPTTNQRRSSSQPAPEYICHPALHGISSVVERCGCIIPSKRSAQTVSRLNRRTNSCSAGFNNALPKSASATTQSRRICSTSEKSGGIFDIHALQDHLFYTTCLIRIFEHTLTLSFASPLESST